MDYTEWSHLRRGDTVKNFTYGKGIIISGVGVGYVVRFDNGKIVKITDGSLKSANRMLLLSEEGGCYGRMEI